LRKPQVKRPHQALGYRMPDQVYASGTNGGDVIAYKYGRVGMPELAAA
jgi:hypothetical protein